MWPSYEPQASPLAAKASVTSLAAHRRPHIGLDFQYGQSNPGKILLPVISRKKEIGEVRG